MYTLFPTSWFEAIISSASLLYVDFNIAAEIVHLLRSHAIGAYSASSPKTWKDVSYHLQIYDKAAVRITIVEGTGHRRRLQLELVNREDLPATELMSWMLLCNGEFYLHTWWSTSCISKAIEAPARKCILTISPDHPESLPRCAAEVTTTARLTFIRARPIVHLCGWHNNSYSVGSVKMMINTPFSANKGWLGEPHWWRHQNTTI